MMLTLESCEKYLDKAPEASITENDVFSNFVSFQGFIEELYCCETDYLHSGGVLDWQMADETLSNSVFPFDSGNYWAQAGWSGIFYGSIVPVDNEPRDKKIWPLCWYGIRKANISLSKLDLMIDGTQEEKDLIKGQALFFRGWFYFELMRYWGGLPYIDTVLSSSEEYSLPRLNYRETALKAAADFRAAADILPVDWDETVAGQTTLGDNRQRISKVMALAYLGKDLLFAGSPMMNEESTGNATFDADLCKESADAFAEAIDVCNTTGMFKLQSWETWTDNFWVWSPSNNTMSGGTEVIMNQTVANTWSVLYSALYNTIPAMIGGGAPTVVPTQNYVKNYGMANGLPIDDPQSGYDPADPWANRDPRFYKDIIVDGDEVVASTAAGIDRYAQLYNGGRFRGGTRGSVTGYYYKKWSPLGNNKWETKWYDFQTYVPWMRLADVYLMYAEAVLQGYGTPQSVAEGSTLTAEQAVNKIRNRALLPNLDSKFTASKTAFMDDIIRERAVELAFEGQRFQDLRRWNLAGKAPYLNKTAIDFDRGADGKPINMKERVVITRVFEKKHNWLPFQVAETKLYKEFSQNPGW